MSIKMRNLIIERVTVQLNTMLSTNLSTNKNAFLSNVQYMDAISMGVERVQRFSDNEC